MRHIILRTNAMPMYGYLSIITARHPQEDTSPRGMILGCGAGRSAPPVSGQSVLKIPATCGLMGTWETRSSRLHVQSQE